MLRHLYKGTNLTPFGVIPMTDEQIAQMQAGQIAVIAAMVELLIEAGALERGAVIAKYARLLEAAESGGTAADRPILHLLHLLQMKSSTPPNLSKG